MNQLQQGDVLLKRVDQVPKGAKEVKRDMGRVVLAYGEATGHCHAIADVDAMFFEKDGKFYLKNSRPVTLSHEEHKPFVVEPGIWEVGQVQEKDWLSGMVSKVVD